MKNYTVDFFLWWYLINGKNIFSKLITNWRFTLESLNLVPMMKNLFLPLFQDYTWEGKLIAVPFRLLWVIFGLIFQIFYSIGLLIVLLVYIVCPLLPILIIASNFIK